VRREAAIAIHDDESIPAALPALAECLDSLGDSPDEALLRRSLSANLRLGTTASGRRLSAYAQRSTAPEPLRIEALEALASWNASPFLDRVEGRVRSLPTRTPDAGRQLLAELIEPLWSKASPALGLVLARLVFEQRLAVPPALLADCVRSPSQPVALRVQALQALARAQGPELPELVQRLTESKPEELRQAALEIQAEQAPAKFFEYARKQWGTATVGEQQWLLRLLTQRPEPDATTLLTQQFDRLTSGTLPQALILDVQEALRQHGHAHLAARAKDWEQAHPEQKSRALLAGGNPEAGRRLFQGSVQGQCARCHNAGGEGQQAGPVLQGIGQRATPETLLESLLDPSARIAEGYATVSLTLKGGETLDGLLLQEREGRLRLGLISGEVRTVPTSDIASRSANAQSVMPPMGEVLSPRELRDLVAFLSSWK
jgi:putative heme-binding domain-containing protein